MTSPQNPWPQGPNPQQFAPPQMNYPQVPPGYSQPPVGGKLPRPGTVSFASVLGSVVPPLSALLSVITFVILLAEFGMPTIPSLWSILGVNVFFTLAAMVCAALWLVFSLLMRGGRGWARIPLVVLAALWLLYDLYSMTMWFLYPGVDPAAYLGGLTSVIGLVQMFLAFVTPVLFMVLVFLKPSNDYFRASRGR